MDVFNTFIRNTVQASFQNVKLNYDTMKPEDAQEKFQQLLREMKTENERIQFLKWIHDNWNLHCTPNDEDDCEKILKSIAEEIRSVVPFDAILPSEKINLPLCGPNSDCKLQSTIHVDEFLYNDEDVDELIEKGELSRHYCGDCYSHNVKLLTFISHSMSVNRIKYLFKFLLPPLKNESIVDVGSRFGGVLFGAYLYTSTSKIIGVEINPELCKIQNDIIKKFNFFDRIHVICSNISYEIELLSSADVLILNNVFEFFTDTEQTISLWHLLVQNVKVGCLLVTVPHLSDTFQHIKVDFDWKDWVEELQPFQPNNFICDDENMQNHKENVKHYKVQKKINLLKK